MIGDSDIRPWGSWHVIDEGEGFKVKRLVVSPHQRLSYQYHEHRAEHWTVIIGKATCEIDGRTTVVGPGDCLEVAVGQAHRIANEQDGELIVIEVQLGRHTDEDDIVRLEDDYGRCD